MGIHYDYKSTKSAKLMEKQAKRERKLAEKKAKRLAKAGPKKSENKTVNQKEKIFEELTHSVDTLINFLQSKNENDFIEIVEYEDG